jgi:hypothetical protein
MPISVHLVDTTLGREGSLKLAKFFKFYTCIDHQVD